MKSPFEQLLRLAKRKQQIVSVHNDPLDCATAYCGFVDCVGPKECRLKTYHRYGDADGWFAFRLEDVLSVDTDGAFEHRIGYFAALEPHTPTSRLLPFLKGNAIIYGTLKQAKDRDLLVSIGLKGESRIIGGQIKELCTSALGILEIDPYGVEDGMVTLPLDRLLHVSVGTQDCLMAQHLREHQTEFLKYKQENRP